MRNVPGKSVQYSKSDYICRPNVLDLATQMLSQCDALRYLKYRYNTNGSQERGVSNSGSTTEVLGYLLFEDKFTHT